VLNCLFINVNLPCSGTVNRLTTCVDLLADIWSWREYYSDCKCVIGGDFNTNLDSCDEVARCLTGFINDCLLVRCDDLFPSQKVNTFVNLSLNQESRIDYVLVSDASDVSQFTVEQQRYTDQYNKRAVDKHFQIGQQVIVLIPDSTNKFLSRW